MAISSAFFATLSLTISCIIVTSLLSGAQEVVYAQKQQQNPLPTSLELNKLRIRSFVQEVLNSHNLTALDKYYSSNATQHNPVGGQGTQGFKNFFKPFFLAFPDVRVTIEHILAENSVVLVFLNWTGMHNGEFQGIPSTNKPINMRTADLFRIGTNGKIVEKWDIVDALNLLKQIGAITFNQSNTKR
jgi:steroid delta-isomerase-like uncharacterized protein